MKRIALILAATVLAAPALGQEFLYDHLIPEPSAIGGSPINAEDVQYETMLRAVFKDAYQYNVRVRSLVTDRSPPNSEFALGLKYIDGKYRIFTLAPSVTIWDYIFVQDEDLQKKFTDLIAKVKAKLPADYHDVSVKQCEIDIPEALAKRIVEIWKLMLLQTQYVEHPLPQQDPNSNTITIVDYGDAVGDWYHFSMSSGMDVLAGRIRQPPVDSKPGMLVLVGDMMADYCDKRSSRTLSKLDQQVTQLMDRLKAQETK